MRTTALLLAVAAVAVALLLARDASRGAAALSGADPAPVAVEAATAALAPLAPLAQDAPAERGEALAAAPSGEARAAVGGAVTGAAESSSPAAPPGPVMGLVVDPHGTPVPGIEVTFEGRVPRAGEGALLRAEEALASSLSPPEALRPSSLSSLPRSASSGLPRYAGGPVRSGPTGAFLFEGTDRRLGGTLRFAGERYLGGPLGAEVDPDAEYQVLRLVSYPRQDAVWTVDVIDRERRPLTVEWADLEFLGGVRGAARMPLPAEREVGPGRVVQRGLPVGRWALHVRVPGALDASVECVIEEPGQLRSMTVVLEPFADATAADVAPSPGAEGRPWIDPSTGLLDWLPPDRLALGEERMNAHFALTFDLGHGPVRAAQLTLRLRSVAHMSGNDALYLEHLGGRRFAFSRAIAELAGGRWEYGDRRTLRLDLGHLPARGEDATSLLPYLEDGRLDVVLQDDTLVESAAVRVLR